MKKFDKIVLTLFLVFTVNILTVGLKDVEQDREAKQIQSNIISYEVVPNGQMRIKTDTEAYYFNLYKDINNFKLLNNDNDIYLYLNNNLSIKLHDADIEKIDITKANYKNYRDSFINLHTKKVWEDAKEEAGIKNELHSYIYYLINRV